MIGDGNHLINGILPESSIFQLYCILNMLRPFRLIYVYFLLAMAFFNPESLSAQGGFVDRVDRAFGSNQELVNGIQFTNQYIRSEGHPYWIDGGFKTGSVCINDQWFEQLQLRYNLFSEKLELGYLTPEGHMNQIITVPENISAFFLEGFSFRRVQIGEEAPAYYQVLTSGGTTCYIKWSRDLLGSRSSGTRFGSIEREYWIQNGERWMNFKNQGSYVRAFPKEQKREFKKLLKQQDFYFLYATASEMVEMLMATMRLLEEGGEP